MGKRAGSAFQKPMALAVMIGLWIAGLGTGGYFMWRYSTTPGIEGRHPSHWPSESRLHASTREPTLLLFLHPLCSCSRATLAELAELQGAFGRAYVIVVLVAPPGADPSFTKTTLGEAATHIPGVTVIEDHDSREATRFDALTSGVALLYSATGELVFAGGITGTRGHAGDNPGLRALRAQLDEPTGIKHSNTYGCAIFDAVTRAVDGTLGSGP